MGTKLLVVDDDANICDLLRLYFENEGYEVKIAGDGIEGLSYFKMYEPDLVLLDIMLPKNKYELKLNGKAVDIPPKELELLYFLASNFNRVFTRDALLDKVWGFDYLGDSRTVDVHVKRLREKLEGVSDKWSLKTVWGVGYKFELIQ